jgi:hypothetical protein
MSTEDELLETIETEEAIQKAPAKPKKEWQPNKTFKLTKEQKIILALLSMLIPTVVFVLIPILARNHYTNRLNIPSEIFLSTPQKISLPETTNVNKVYNINLNGYDFPIPDNFSPSRIDENSITFRETLRADARRIYITANPHTQPLNYSKLGISRWFLPRNTFQFVQLILNATWHPIRLMFKAQYYTIEGLNSKIYQCNFGNSYSGFVYPSAGQEGYMARAFNKGGPGYFDYHIKDPVNPPTLNEWLNHTSKIRPLELISEKPDQAGASKHNLHSLIQLSRDGENENEILSIGLSEYFRTKSPEWLIPVLEILSNRGYYPDLIAMHQRFNKYFLANPTKAVLWENIMDKAVDKILKIDLDVYETSKELAIYCKNLSDLEIDELELRIVVTDYYGQTNSFLTHVVKAGKILPGFEKNAIVRIPKEISIRDSKLVSHQVTKLLFAE